MLCYKPVDAKVKLEQLYIKIVTLDLRMRATVIRHLTELYLVPMYSTRFFKVK